MIAVIQRVKQASVTVAGERIARIGQGLLVLLGVAKGDTNSDVAFMVKKIPELRMFSDLQGHMNHSLEDIHGELLLVSQFTLLANMNRGRRPSFECAALPEEAYARYQDVFEKLKTLDLVVQGGLFGESMVVSLENDGPVTLILNSQSTESENS